NRVPQSAARILPASATGDSSPSACPAARPTPAAPLASAPRSASATGSNAPPSCSDPAVPHQRSASARAAHAHTAPFVLTCPLSWSRAASAPRLSSLAQIPPARREKIREPPGWWTLQNEYGG